LRESDTFHVDLLGREGDTMIWESRKWRLITRIVAMAVATILMFAVAGPASYALQDDTPKHIMVSRQLYDEKGTPVANKYIYVEALPDLAHVVTTGEGSSTHYLIPISGFDHQLFIYTEKGKYLFPFDYTPEAGFLVDSTPIRYDGKVTTLHSQANSDEAFEGLAQHGIYADKETAMVLMQGEEPSNYRPMVPIMPLLALLWAIASIGAWQIWRGRRTRRRPAYAS
jgi:hypothetical protein